MTDRHREEPPPAAARGVIRSSRTARADPADEEPGSGKAPTREVPRRAGAEPGGESTDDGGQRVRGGAADGDEGGQGPRDARARRQERSRN
ncbi:hypothetical protein [Streptomyces sp. NPDC059247]|uniref:hypothetical protein n=1 Tax=Streptomyces sp. NPDC059247 TaxID=3346790 RepID=UPI0036AE7FAD